MLRRTREPIGWDAQFKAGVRCGAAGGAAHAAGRRSALLLMMNAAPHDRPRPQLAARGVIKSPRHPAQQVTPDPGREQQRDQAGAERPQHHRQADGTGRARKAHQAAHRISHKRGQRGHGTSSSAGRSGPTRSSWSLRVSLTDSINWRNRASMPGSPGGRAGQLILRIPLMLAAVLGGRRDPVRGVSRCQRQFLGGEAGARAGRDRENRGLPSPEAGRQSRQVRLTGGRGYLAG